jgi:hypothetical protein
VCVCKCVCGVNFHHLVTEGKGATVTGYGVVEWKLDYGY